ncbi:HNH endonuclease signature motif containing protein, partial [Actinomadura alba]
TLGGAGRINGDLTAEATALAETVIESLAVKAGPADTRTKAQRRHDAFAEAMRRLAESGLLPERGGCKPQIKVDIDLETLRALPGSAQAEEEWIEHAAARLARDRLHNDRATRELLVDRTPGELPPGLAAPRPGTATPNPPFRGPLGSGNGPGQESLPGLGGGATLHGVGPIGNGLAGALACDSVITPTVTATVDLQALAEMTEEWLAFHFPKRATGRTGEGTRTDGSADGLRTDGSADGLRTDGSADGLRTDGSGDGADRCCDRAPAEDAANHPLADLSSADGFARLQRSMLRWAIRVLSGPGGLASYLRTGLLERPLGGPSIVLDAGADGKTVPTALERLVRRRDRGCRFPGCDHPAALSQVHHIVPRSRNGPTALWNLLTLCSFHHLIAVHTWGWDIRLDPDGTTTAIAPDGR